MQHTPKLENTNKPLDSSNIGSGNGANYSPPRGLKDIFSSESKTQEFEAYLEEIDNENEDQVMVTRLHFVLQCKKLDNSIKSIDLCEPSTQISFNSLDMSDNQTKTEIKVK